MKEKVGKCSHCGRTIFCISGFLNGVIHKEGVLICFPCVENHSQIENKE